MKIKKGSVLNLRKDLIDGQAYGVAIWHDSLQQGEVIVKSYDKLSKIIKLENDFQGNCYTKEMFEEFN